MTPEEFDAWPKCAVPACQNKCCLSLKSKYCWPHTAGSPGEAFENLRETEPEPFDFDVLIERYAGITSEPLMEQKKENRG